VIAFLRLLGIMNAMVWFGAALFFTFGIAPAFFSPEMKRLLGEIYTGLVAQLVLERYFVLHYCCGAIAVLHQFAEWVYLGKRLQQGALALLTAILLLAICGGAGLAPRLKELHRIKYSPQSSPAQKQQAAATFRTWHGASQVMNLLVLLGLAAFAWRLSIPTNNGPRFTPGKFRS
jgi:hypothetical protein